MTDDIPETDDVEHLCQENRALRDQADELRRSVRAKAEDLAELTQHLKSCHPPRSKTGGSKG
ncbi:hypothetical protein AAD018_015665 [Aestuariibius insulae]|uniref:hypothetical protein n=1 Tax=Aestuariibius insulae TaxID=2058287 RepID=UPI00345E9C2A